MRPLAEVADRLLEATVVGSFTKVGHGVRRRLDRWASLDEVAAAGGFAGSRVVLTGATSGIGAAAAEHLVALGAELHIVGRDRTRTEQAARRIAAAAPAASVGGTRADTSGASLAGSVEPHVADLTDLCAVSVLCDTLTGRFGHVDALIHNAGALVHDYRLSPTSHEETYTAQVLAPFLMTDRLLPLLSASDRGGRVIVVSSGGMYAERLVPAQMQMAPKDYDGVRAYARAKRAQVELVVEGARRLAGTGVSVHAMHPGWADTPGVRQSLPGFHRVTRAVLRDPLQGADTAVWLAVSPEAGRTSGRFWLDRRPRGTTRLPGTSATDEQRRHLWELVRQQAYGALDECGSRDQNSSSPATT